MGKPFVDVVLDAAGQRAPAREQPARARSRRPRATIVEAVFARNMSAIKDERVAASKDAEGDRHRARKERSHHVERDPRRALLKICAYAQGFQLMAAAAHEHHWSLDWRDRADLPRRLYHPRALSSEDHGSLRAGQGAQEPPPRSVLQGHGRKGRAELAIGRRARGARRREHSFSSTLLRRVPHGATPPRTCSKRSATTSARIPTSASTSREESSSTSTGPIRSGRNTPCKESPSPTTPPPSPPPSLGRVEEGEPGKVGVLGGPLRDAPALRARGRLEGRWLQGAQVSTPTRRCLTPTRRRRRPRVVVDARASSSDAHASSSTPARR